MPLFESDDLINWTQIGHVLTRKEQVMLEKINSSGGVFAPTIRFNNGRFYMVTTNDTTRENFYVYTDDIRGEWSEAITVDQGGIDPSLFFENGKAYFMSTCGDGRDRNHILQCEIDIATGEKHTESISLWTGTGGRYLESPHLYKIGDWYYLMAAEGGTEYGHMITCARAKSVWGPFEAFPHNPVLTNRDKAPRMIQGIGHGDLIADKIGGWHILSLGFRQIHKWMPYHHLGREVFLTPVTFDTDGFFTAGNDGTTEDSYEFPGDFTQNEQRVFTFENTRWDLEWVFLRHPHTENYALAPDRAVLKGTKVTLDEADSPTFVGIRQRDFSGSTTVRVSLDAGEAGMTLYMSESEHYEVALRRENTALTAIVRLNIGDCKHLLTTQTLPAGMESALLTVRMNAFGYSFSVSAGDAVYELGGGQTKYLSSEVSGGFTGVVIGLYAVGDNTAEFTDFRVEYTD
ncbi:MAG: glycoside hydrolase family 43 protein [Oscillospiraceae bacterium]